MQNSNTFTHRKNRGSALVAVLVTLGVFVAIIAILGLYLANIYNDSARQENGLTAQLDVNKSIRTTYGQKVAEAAQVPDMMRDDLIKVTTAALEGRYGADGSRAVFQAIQEQNPNVSEKLYEKLQTIIVAGRDEFNASQTILIDRARVYQNALDTVPGGVVRKFMGFPRVDMNSFKPILTSEVETIFQKGKEDGPIKLRQPATAQ